MRLSDEDVRRIARAVAIELRSGSPSTTESGALVKGDQCDEKEESEFMDPTSTEESGASSSPEQIAARLLDRSRQRQKRNVLPMPLARSRKVER